MRADDMSKPPLYRHEIQIDLKTARHATILDNSLSVCPTLNTTDCHTEIGHIENRFFAIFETSKLKTLRVKLNSFYTDLHLATQTIERFDPHPTMTNLNLVGKRMVSQEIPATRKLQKSQSSETEHIAKQCIDAIRLAGAKLPQIANSGHPGAPMGCAPIAHALWSSVMRFNPSETHWINRDRFILSNGHASALLYCMLHLTGYEISLDDLHNFRKLNSVTPGHPECFTTSGVEVCTGPLGQGIANGVGMAIAAHHLSEVYNESNFNLFDHYVYVLCGDGCLQEGISSEASSLAGHLGLYRLIVIYDDNKITIDGSTDLSFTEDVTMRYKAYGWNVVEICNTDPASWQIVDAIEACKKIQTKPSIIRVKTTIGYGSSISGTEKAHGAPLGEKETRKLSVLFGQNEDDNIHFPENVREFYNDVVFKKKTEYDDWIKLMNQYKTMFPEKAEEITRRFNRSLPTGLTSALESVSSRTSDLATRAHSGHSLNCVSNLMPELVGGSADLTNSNAVNLKNTVDFNLQNRSGRFLRFGVREHAMAAICNGLYAYGGFRPFCATFLNFLSYCWPAVRLSALSRFGVLYICTHDSIELGEDGPTHQPIEIMPLLRSTPNLISIRPCDGNEVTGAYMIWSEEINRPTVICLCRSSVPHIKNTDAKLTFKGAYILSDFNSSAGKQVILAGSGSEVKVCVKAKEILSSRGYNVRLVSMPSWNLFEEQSDEYKESIFCQNVKNSKKICRVYVEASSTFGWDKYFNVFIGMSTFGVSAPAQNCLNYFGFTGENVVEKVIRYFDTE